MSNERNVLSHAYKYLIPVCFIVGVMNPKAGFYVLLTEMATLDLLKRFLIVYGNVTILDLYFILGLAPVTMLGVAMGAFTKRVRGQIEPLPGDFKRVGIAVFVFLLLTGYALGAGARGSSQTGIAGIANAGAYVPMIFTIPFILRSYTDVRKAMVYVMVLFSFVALYGIKQGTMGLAGWELDYLESGLTQEVRILYEQEALRIFSTMNGAATLSIFMSILAVGAIVFVKRRGQSDLGMRSVLVRVSVFLLFTVCAYFTISRGGWVCGLVALGAWIVVRFRLLTYLAYVSSILAVVLIIYFSQSIVQSGVLADAEASMRKDVSTDNALGERVVVTGTLVGRLDSFRELHNPDVWSPFGLLLAGREEITDSFLVHDIITDTLVRIGYVPMAVGGIVGLFLMYRAHDISWRMRPGPHRNMLYWIYAMLAGLMVGSLANPAQLRTYPVNTLFFMLIGMAISIVLQYRRELALEAEAQATEREVIEPTANRELRPRFS